MRLFSRFRSDIPFSRDDANRFLPWIVAFMVSLSALMLCLGLALNESLHARQAAFSQQFTVQIPHEVATEETVESIRASLSSLALVKDVKVASREEVQDMVAPWLGNTSLVESLPLPTVIHVKTGRGDAKEMEKIAASLAGLDPQIVVDSHELWAEKFARFSRVVQIALYTLAGFIVATLSAMVVFTAREAMKLHTRTVFLLHAIGADDRYIARQFQNNALQLSLKGALVGTLIGALLFIAAGKYAAMLNAPFLPSLSLSNTHIILLVLLPPFCALTALLSSRFAVLSQLKALP